MNFGIKVSVIIPTFNRCEVLARALSSVILQGYKNLEIIVVDDGSTDLTRKLIEEKFPKVNYYYQTNKGVSSARNFAIKKSTGKYVSLLDSDDEWEKDKLQQQVIYFQENPQAKLVHTNEKWIRNGQFVNQMKKHRKGGGDQFIPSLELCLISPSSVMFTRQLFDEIGGFREDFPVCEDYDYWLKVTSRYEVGYIDNPLTVKYGGHDDQLSRTYFAMDFWRIKSIDWILKNRELSADQYLAARETLLKKSRILLKGYLKHQNFTNYDEVNRLLLDWQS